MFRREVDLEPSLTVFRKKPVGWLDIFESDTVITCPTLLFQESQ